MSGDDAETVIRKYALQNAVFHKGKANPKAVAGKILGERPELRARAAEVGPLVESVVAEVNALGPEAQAAELRRTDPSLLVKEKKERRSDLPDLESVDGPVVMRIAPGPSGPLHIGHTRVSILNDEYVKRYGGKLICRFEDTNPEKIDPEAYDMIPEDLEWLGVKVHEYAVQSDRFEIYYDIVRRLVEAGHAYVCTCDGDAWRALKERKAACPCRSLPVEEQLERYDRLLAGGYGDGEAVAVVKTAIDHPNPAVRDFVALRVVSAPHPRVGTKYSAYPMMNLSVAVDDHLMGMTHVIRGKDHLNNTLRQEYIYRYMGWPEPVFYHYGLVNIPDTVLKTSLIKKSIKDGEYAGWDDVRTGTVRALERRGIRPEAIRRYWIESGIKQIDIQFSWENLFAMNRDLIDGESNRYFFVQDPVRYDIEGADAISGRAPLHPDHPERGFREYSVAGPKTVFVSATDSAAFAASGRVRLKDLCNLGYGTPARYEGDDLSVLKQGVRAVQWVGRASVPAEVLMPDGSTASGLTEDAILKEEGRTVQFERFGFARIEEMSPDGVKAVFCHRRSRQVDEDLGRGAGAQRHGVVAADVHDYRAGRGDPLHRDLPAGGEAGRDELPRLCRVAADQMRYDGGAAGLHVRDGRQPEPLAVALAGVVARHAVRGDLRADHPAEAVGGLVGHGVLEGARLLVGDLRVDLQDVRQEALDDVVLAPEVPGVHGALLRQRDPLVPLVHHHALLREDLQHLGDAGGGHLHEVRELRGLDDAGPLCQSQDVDQVVFAVAGGHGPFV